MTIAGMEVASPAVYEWQSSRDLLVAAGGTTPATAHVWNLEREMCQDQVSVLAAIWQPLAKLESPLLIIFEDSLWRSFRYVLVYVLGGDSFHRSRTRAC